MTKKIIILLLLLVSILLYSDSIYKFVKYKKNISEDEFIISYISAYNKEGREMIKNIDKNSWYLRDLIKWNDKGFVVDKTKIVKECVLSDGKYKIEIMPVPGNRNVNARCGAWLTAKVTVYKDDKLIFTKRFEVDCHSIEGRIRQIKIKANFEQPEIMYSKD